MLESSCPRCHGHLVAIALQLEGRDLVMQSCSRCDVRFWHDAAEDAAVELTDVLGRDPARQPALR